jgi:hypothetical protein
MARSLPFRIAALMLYSLASFAQDGSRMTRKDVCGKLSNAVVRIDVVDGVATGFIVSRDGWILTAGHVLFDPKTHEQHTVVTVRLFDGSTEMACSGAAPRLGSGNHASPSQAGQVVRNCIPASGQESGDVRIDCMVAKYETNDFNECAFTISARAVDYKKTVCMRNPR